MYVIRIQLRSPTHACVQTEDALGADGGSPASRSPPPAPHGAPLPSPRPTPDCSAARCRLLGGATAISS